MKEIRPPLSCEILLEEELIIKNLSERIVRDHDGQERVELAQEMLDRLEPLLACPKYEVNNHDCGTCRTISGLRKITAERIIKGRATKV